MTTTFPAPRRIAPTPVPSAPVPSTPVPASASRAALSACPVERRALATAARDLADALTGIASDARCGPARQRAVVEFSAGVLRAAQAVATRTGQVSLHRACRAVEHAAPVFAACVSTGAPRLAAAWTALAELVEADGGPGHDHPGDELVACERRFRAVPGRRARFAVPMFADACTPAQRLRLVSAAPRRVRLALRLGEDRWLDLRDAVRGAAPAS